MAQQQQAQHTRRLLHLGLSRPLRSLSPPGPITPESMVAPTTPTREGAATAMNDVKLRPRVTRVRQEYNSIGSLMMNTHTYPCSLSVPSARTFAFSPRPVTPKRILTMSEIRIPNIRTVNPPRPVTIETLVNAPSAPHAAAAATRPSPTV